MGMIYFKDQRLPLGSLFLGRKGGESIDGVWVGKDGNLTTKKIWSKHDKMLLFVKARWRVQRGLYFSCPSGLFKIFHNLNILCRKKSGSMRGMHILKDLSYKTRTEAKKGNVCFQWEKNLKTELNKSQNSHTIKCHITTAQKHGYWLGKMLTTYQVGGKRGIKV